MSKRLFVRISRHPFTEERREYVQKVFGDDIFVVTEDIPYGDDAIASVNALLERLADDGSSVIVALEAQAPFPVLQRLVESRRQLRDSPLLIRVQFARDAGGRARVIGTDDQGRDVLAFSHYEILERIEFQTRRL